jgi:hypothetical protein
LIECGVIQPSVQATWVATDRAALQDGFRTAPAALDADSAAGFFAFEEACQAGAFPQARVLKGQITGPLTLGQCLVVDGQPLVDDATLLVDLTVYLSRLARWQVERLQRFGRPVLLCVDEPVLGINAWSPLQLRQLHMLLDVIRGAGGLVGLHSCAPGALAPMLKAAPDVISFDAQHAADVVTTSAELVAFLEGGGWLGLGVVPTDPNHMTLPPRRLLAPWRAAAKEAGLQPDQWRHQLVVTATCGLGLCSIDVAQQSFDLAHRVASRLTASDPTISSTEVADGTGGADASTPPW